MEKAEALEYFHEASRNKTQEIGKEREGSRHEGRGRAMTFMP